MPHLAVVPPTDAPDRLRRLARSWSGNTGNERAVFQTWLIRFCEALGVEPPDPPTDDYRFELPIRMIDREGRESTNFIDCWKRGHFAMEAKASAGGAASRDDTLLRKAFGQVRNYVAHVSGDAPPYLMVVDVARTLIVWDRWSGGYGDYAAGRRIALATLHERPDDIGLLYDIFAQPAVRDPRGRAQQVTTQIAGELAQLAARLEARGFENERVARFLMRCVFSCFAEDVGLLPAEIFRRTLETARAGGNAEHLALALTSLWRTMDQGGMYGAEMLHRFNGHFFASVEALPLEPADVELLISAARHDWSRVEPSIFGTLLVRALDPEERHRLGAEYTPRAYIERLVEPTVVEPIRERWTAVQAAVLQLEDTGRKKEHAAAIRQLRQFHGWMRGLSFLDPACGSGNFLYVTMAAVKRIELEVLNEIQRLSGGQAGLVLDEVHPRQFHGIEVKRWAREIAELTLWIGYHQFWRETHGGRTPPDPILEDTGTIECRDAVLAWDEIVRRPDKDRLDPTPRIVSPVTGELVPDPNAKLEYNEYVGARQAEWPRADFIVGNPPYMGQARQRDAFGDGYVEALRSAHPDVPDSVDFVGYWWYRSAKAVSRGDTIRAGLITTNSISQGQNRALIRQGASEGADVVWVVADHPWVTESDGAAVRIAMTVLSRTGQFAKVVEVDDRGFVTSERQTSRLNSDLTSTADVASSSAIRLRANVGISSDGVKLHGSGFLLSPAEALPLLRSKRNSQVVKRYLNGRDVAQRTRSLHVIDFATRTVDEARDFPELFEIVRDRVKPGRDSTKDKSTRDHWWKFGRNREEFRPALEAFERFIATVDTARHRYFLFVDANTIVDDKLVAIALSDGCPLGVLSSAIHVTWSDAAGARMGMGNDPVYVKTRCFDPFPFPDPTSALRPRIASVAERLDQHRKDAIARDARVTMTGMYNVVEKLRSGVPLTVKERAVHEIAACGILRDLHDELDALVAGAYGWPWPMEREEILERLVALHDERVEEERRGLVRWLRPDYQIPRFGADLAPAAEELSLASDAEPAVDVQPPWPATAVEQLSATASLVAQRAVSAEEATAHFAGARRDQVARHLETLAIMGEVVVDADGRYTTARRAA